MRLLQCSRQDAIVPEGFLFILSFEIEFNFQLMISIQFFQNFYHSLSLLTELFQRSLELF